MKTGIRILSVLFALSLLLPAVFSVAVSAENEAYVKELTDKGFPQDYAEKLTVLHKKHPEWTFEPINITELSGGKYTWEYVLYMETEDNPKRSLVPNGDSYVVLRDMSSYEQYDSGWWKASRATVEYFMDPRNFIDEQQIFQFYDLKWSDSVTLKAVEAAVKGTFMENKKLDYEYSDTTYAQFFYDTGKELGASPVYLAARVRAEQGTSGSSSLINGLCGDKLWYYYSNKITGSENGHLIKAPTSGYTEAQLKSYNGLYNYFNIGAAGTGYFAIYLGGMNEAKKGTPEKAAEWGGASWNTRWKSIYGGAYKATNTYINDYQNTPYFQKFNVDPRSSRNFWGQYMQSIHGSTNVATTFYNSFKENKMLDLPYSFLIPVFDGMPDSCPYPDGSELAVRKYVYNDDTETADFIDMSKLDGVKKRYAKGKVTWRVFAGETGKYLPLGKVDLSKYSSVCIEYSVAANFDRDACGINSYIGLITDPEHIYGGEGSEEDLTADVGHKRINDGKNGYLHRAAITIDLTDAAYCGPVYLSAYTQENQVYLIHNIVFLTAKGYDAPEPIYAKTEPETETETDTEAVTETETETETEEAVEAIQTETETERINEQTGAVSVPLIMIVSVSASLIVGFCVFISVRSIMKNKKPKENIQTDEKD